VHRHWAVAAATLPAEKLTTRAAAAASDTTMGRIEILGHTLVPEPALWQHVLVATASDSADSD
jgi:hypothetical protein